MYQKITMAVASVLLVLAGAGTANAQTTAFINDPAGDQTNNVTANNHRNDAFFDILRVAVSKGSGDFTMTMRVAAPIPQAPPSPPGENGKYVWLFVLDTQDGRISGFPFPSGPGVSRPFEYMVQLTWNGEEYAAEVIDRTPLPTGGEAIVTPIPFSFNPTRDEISLTVDPGLIGNLTSFKWNTLTAIVDGREGSEGSHLIDNTCAHPSENPLENICDASWPE